MVTQQFFLMKILQSGKCPFCVWSISPAQERFLKASPWVFWFLIPNPSLAVLLGWAVGRAGEFGFTDVSHRRVMAQSIWKIHFCAKRKWISPLLCIILCAAFQLVHNSRNLNDKILIFAIAPRDYLQNYWPELKPFMLLAGSWVWICLFPSYPGCNSAARVFQGRVYTECILCFSAALTWISQHLPLLCLFWPLGSNLFFFP